MGRGLPVPIARLAVVACALLVLVGCGVRNTTDTASSATTASPTAAAERSDYRAPGDDIRKSLGHGVVLTASAPKTFTPTDTAYPRATRAIAIDVVIDNGGSIPFRPSQLSFLATVDGAQAEQVIDSTQGYNGLDTDEVAPNQALTFSIAFGVPEKTCSIHVSVRPDATGSMAVELYDGVV